MGDASNVFISWSGERSRQAAGALRGWLRIVLQNAKPWMSDTDIEKGSRGLDEVSRALEGMKVGIICLTPENLSAHWILFEAGALSKTLDPKSRLCTYLLAGLQPQHVKPPLGMFQATRADRDDTRKLVHSINKHLDVTPVSDADLDALFDKMWPDLEAKLSALPAPAGIVPPTRSPEEMLAEILELTRAIVPEIQEISREAAITRAARELPVWARSSPGLTITSPLTASGAQLRDISDIVGTPIVLDSGLPSSIYTPSLLSRKKDE